METLFKKINLKFILRLLNILKIKFKKIFIIVTVIFGFLELVNIIKFRHYVKTQNYLNHDQVAKKNNRFENFQQDTQLPPAEDQNIRLKVLLIGVKKCGTTATLTFIAQHPQVLMKRMPKLCNPFYPGLKEEDIAFLKSARVSRKVGLVASNLCLHNIEQFDLLERPDKLIVLLCDPTLRVYSDYKQIVIQEGYNRKFERILSEAIPAIKVHEGEENFAKSMSRFHTIGRLDYTIVTVSYYYEFLKEFYERYEAKDILIMNAAELKASPLTYFEKLENYLGVQSFFKSTHFKKNHFTGNHCFKENATSTPVCIRPNVRQFPPPNQDTINTLKDLYHPYNEKLFQLINETFDWI